MKKILVTGGSGFIGTNIIDFYKNENEILNIDINPPRNKSHLKYWQDVNLLDEEKLLQEVSKYKPQLVFHMGARTDLDGKKLTDYDANIKGVENIIKTISVTDSIEKVIFASSRLVCEIGYSPVDEFDYKPSTIYGESKVIGEKIVRDSKILNKRWVIVRPTSLWGPWFDIPYKSFFDSISRKIYFHPKGMKIFKKFGYIGNSVHIMNKLMQDNILDSNTIYLSDFSTLEVKEWADIISQEFHGRNVKTIPLFMLKALAIIGDILKMIGYKAPPLTSFRLNNILTTMNFDTYKVEKIVGELPFSLEEGTKITHNWYKENK